MLLLGLGLWRRLGREAEWELGRGVQALGHCQVKVGHPGGVGGWRADERGVYGGEGAGRMVWD